MTLADQGLPRPILGLDVRDLPLSPEEAFVLSRVDGNSTASEIAAATGLSEERVSRCLHHLHELGAIFLQEDLASDRAGPESPTPPPRRTISSTQVRFAVESPRQLVVNLPTGTYDSSLLDEPIDLDLDRKRLILDHYGALDALTHYAILGVSEEATKSEIRQAYYERVGFFHPDRYFGKNLGSFKPRLEKVFGALTKAYDTLTRKRSREEYDQYLAARRRTAGLSDSRAPQRLTPAPSPAVPTPPRAPAPTTPAVEARSSASSQPHSAATPLSTPSVPPLDPESQRQALARKLRARGSIPPPATPVDAETRAQRASEDLRSRYAQRRDGPSAQVERYKNFATTALEAGHFASAINALKVALSVSPDDPTLTSFLTETQHAADVAHADQFLERARYEEKDGRHGQAATSYERAARGKRSANLYDRAAQCLLLAGTDPRRAADLAKKAVDLDNNRGTYHLTLARAYHAGGMFTSATRELERALELAPDNDEVKTWAKRLKK